MSSYVNIFPFHIIGIKKKHLKLQSQLAFQMAPRGNTAGRVQDNNNIIVDEEPLE